MTTCITVSRGLSAAIIQQEYRAIQEQFLATDVFEALPVANTKINRWMVVTEQDLTQSTDERIELIHLKNFHAISGVLYCSFDAQCLHFIGDLSFEPNLYELRCNLDDMTPEKVAAAQKLFFVKGALDCWVSPITMKDGRVAHEFQVLCDSDRLALMNKLFFDALSTIGFRTSSVNRLELFRHLIDGEKVYYDTTGKKSKKIEHAIWESQYLQSFD